MPRVYPLYMSPPQDRRGLLNIIFSSGIPKISKNRDISIDEAESWYHLNFPQTYNGHSRRCAQCILFRINRRELIFYFYNLWGTAYGLSDRNGEVNEYNKSIV